MTVKKFSRKFEIKLGDQMKQFSKLDSPNGHKFLIKVFGSQKKLTFNIKNTGSKSVSMLYARLTPSQSYACKYDFQLDPGTAIDLCEPFSWCKPEEVRITLELEYKIIRKTGN